jgi:hypothetical protein
MGIIFYVEWFTSTGEVCGLGILKHLLELLIDQ